MSESVQKPQLKEGTIIKEELEELERGVLTEEVLLRKKKGKEKKEQVTKVETAKVEDVVVVHVEESKVEETRVTVELIKKKVVSKVEKKGLEGEEEYSEEEIELPLPLLETKPAPARVREGETIRLTYKLAEESEATVRWAKNGQNLTPEADSRLKFGCDSKTGLHYLEVVEAEFEDIGEYTLRAENDGGIIACTVSVNVISKIEKKPPKMEDYPKPHIVKEGANIELSCKVTGLIISLLLPLA